jgi:lipoate---protein ligase
VSTRGVRSAEKPVSPLAWFTDLPCDEVARRMTDYFAREFRAPQTQLSAQETDQAHRLVTTKYATAAWINRLP